MITREAFFSSLDTQPIAKVFFEKIAAHFEPYHDVVVHFTETNKGDLRLALPWKIIEQKRDRNFATMYWQKRKKMCSVDLTCRQLNVIGSVFQIRLLSQRIRWSR